MNDGPSDPTNSNSIIEIKQGPSDQKSIVKTSKSPDKTHRQHKRPTDIQAKPILIQLINKLIKRYHDPQAKLGRIGQERVSDITKFALYAGILTAQDTNKNRDYIRSAIRSWWKSPTFDVPQQIGLTLTLAQFDCDAAEARLLVEKQTNLVITDPKNRELNLWEKTKEAYKSALLNKEHCTPVTSDGEETSGSESSKKSSESSDTSDEELPHKMTEIKPKLTPRYYSGINEDPEKYFDHFRRIATNLNWTAKTTLEMLPCFFIGRRAETL